MGIVNESVVPNNLGKHNFTVRLPIEDIKQNETLPPLSCPTKINIVTTYTAKLNDII